MPLAKLNTSFTRFAVVGGLNTLLGVSLFPILYKLSDGRIHHDIILFVSYAVCTLFAFTMHKLVTFNTPGKTRQQGAKFLLLTGVLFFINAALLELVHYLFPQFDLALVQPVLAVLLQLGNYVVLKRFVFAQGPAKKA